MTSNIDQIIVFIKSSLYIRKKKKGGGGINQRYYPNPSTISQIFTTTATETAQRRAAGLGLLILYHLSKHHMVHTEWQVTQRLTFKNKEVTIWRLPVQQSDACRTERGSRLQECVSALRAAMCKPWPCATRAMGCSMGDLYPEQGAQQGLCKSDTGLLDKW